MKKQDGFPGQLSYVIPDKILELVKQNPLISDLHLTDIGFYPEARHHFKKREQGIDQTILIYNIGGKGSITIGNKNLEIPPNHFIIIPEKFPHAYSADKNNPWSIYWIHFSGLKANHFSQTIPAPVHIDKGKISRINERLEFFDEIFRNLERGFSIETLEYINLCLPHLLASFTHLGQFRLIKKLLEKDPIELSINYMLENLNLKLKLNDMANAVSLSSSHFSRIFTNRTGHSPIDYFIQLKIQQACRILDNSNKSISQVSNEMGFEDQFYFSRQFKKVMNMSPREYRKR